MSDSVWPHRQQPTRLPRPWDSPGKNTGVGCHFLLQCMKVKSESEVAQSCPTLSDPMDCSLPGSSVHGIFQARVLEIMLLDCNYTDATMIELCWCFSEETQENPSLKLKHKFCWDNILLAHSNCIHFSERPEIIVKVQTTMRDTNVFNPGGF